MEIVKKHHPDRAGADNAESKAIFEVRNFEQDFDWDRWTRGNDQKNFLFVANVGIPVLPFFKTNFFQFIKD